MADDPGSSTPDNLLAVAVRIAREAADGCGVALEGDVDCKIGDGQVAPDINESQHIAWVPLDQALDRMAKGEIVGAASVVGLMRAKMIRDQERRQAAVDS